MTIAMYLPAGFDSDENSESEWVVDWKPQKTSNQQHNTPCEATPVDQEVEITQNVIKEKEETYFVTAELISKKVYGNVDAAEENLKRIIIEEDVDLLATLIADGEVDKNFIFSSGWSMIAFSLFSGKFSVTKSLLQCGVDIHKGSLDCISALAYKYYPSLDHLQESLVQLSALVDEYGADVNFQDRMGFTPLMVAIKNDNLHIADELLKKNVDVFLCDMSNNNIFDYALMKENFTSLQLILHYFEKFKEHNTYTETTDEHQLTFHSLLQSLINEKNPSTPFKYYLESLLRSNQAPPPYPFKDVLEYCMATTSSTSRVSTKKQDGDVLFNFLCGIQCEKWFKAFEDKKVTFKKLLPMDANDLIYEVKMDSNTANTIVCAKNEILMHGMHTNLFQSSNYSNLGLFDLALSNANVARQIELINDFCVVFQKKLSTLAPQFGHSEYFVKLVNTHACRSISLCENLKKDLLKIKKMTKPKHITGGLDLKSAALFLMLFAAGGLTIFAVTHRHQL